MAREEGKKVKMKQSTASRVFDLCNTILMVLFCITILLPSEIRRPLGGRF